MFDNLEVVMITMKPIEELTRDEKLERLGLKPRRDVPLNPGACFDVYRQFEIRTGVKIAVPEPAPEPLKSPERIDAVF